MKIKLLIAVLLFQIMACARSYMVKSDSQQFTVEQVNMIAVAYNRPDFPPADRDDFSNKNRPFHCMSANVLWKEQLDAKTDVLECLNSLEDTKAVYFYVPATQPYLQIDVEEKENPKCLVEKLAKIPLPREIYYLGREEGHTMDGEPQRCFSSSFSTRTNEMMQTPTGFLKKKITLTFPLDRKLKSAHDLSMWLMVTTFTILKNDEQADQRILGKLVADTICKACFKHDAHFDDKYTDKMKAVFWP